MSILSLDIYTVNGDRLQYSCDDEEQVAKILHQLHGPRVFSNKAIILASEFSVTNIPGETIEAISLSSISPETHGLDDLDGQIIEISQEDFEKEYAELSPEERLAARNASPGETILIYLQLNLLSGRKFFLKLQVPKKPGHEGKIFFTHLFDNPSIMFSSENGKTIVNPKRLASMVNFPGPGDDVLPGTTLYANSKNLFLNSSE